MKRAHLCDSLFGLAAVAFLLAGCQEKTELANLVVVTIDTLRYDHCSSYGYARDTTPVLDRLAGDGVRFETAYAPMSTTGPSHASLFTSLYPLVHGVRKNGNVLSGDVLTLAERLRGRGYQTAAVVSAFPLDSKFGYDQGFEVYEDENPEDSSSGGGEGKDPGATAPGERASRSGKHFDQRANVTTDLALDWLEQHAQEGPFFLWVHYFDPHSSYDPPQAYRDLFPPDPSLNYKPSFDTRPYDGEVRFADHEMGRLLERLDQLVPAESTLVVVTADHGEGLMEHNHNGHGLLLFEEAVRIPLVMRWTGRIPGARVLSETVENIDVLPTVLALLGVSPDSSPGLGRDLSAWVLDEAPPPSVHAAFIERRLYESKRVKGVPVAGEKFALVKDRWKLIEAKEEGTLELYDLRADPHEVVNVADDHQEKVKELQSQLQAIHSALQGMTPSATSSVSEDDSRRLEALGYAK